MSDDGRVEVIKLKAVGDAVTLDVSTAGLLPMGSYPEIEFTGLDRRGRIVAVRVPKQSADRQLVRLNVSQASDLVGRRLTIEREKNDKQPAKPYWGLYVESNGSHAGHGSAAAIAPAAAAAPVATREKRSALYDSITGFVLKKIVPQYKENGVPCTAGDIAEMVRTIYEGETRHA